MDTLTKKYRILNNIESPEDLKQLSISDLNDLCEEIREYIVGVVCGCGGHLAPSLGVVELTLALHYVYNIPVDKLIFDVGHQCYVHKIITGRREAFKWVRQEGGISGFPHPAESPCDAFATGHASTSISAALGYATARDIAGQDYNVVAVIGDGSLTGGLAYEGLNHAGASGKKMLVVLNDNQMSIAPNVGAFSRYLNNIMLDPRYSRFKSEIWDITEKLPVGKDQVRRFAHRMEESLKNLIVPGIVFEELGFKYFGPVEGHNVEELVRILRTIRKLDGPILLHVITKKGKGYSFAEENPTRFHGTGGFDRSTGLTPVSTGAIAFSKAFGEAALELAQSNERITAITAAMPDGTGLKNFQKELPERFFDVGIAEEHAVTFAAGQSLAGMRPLVALYSTFLQRAIDMAVVDVALQNCPVVFGIDRAGIVGDDGPTHNGVFDLSFMSMIPGMIVSAPRDEIELRDLLYTAFMQEEHPFSIRYPRGAGIGTLRTERFKKIEIGTWEMMEEGEDVALLAVGTMVHTSVWAAKLLRADGVNPTVVNCRFVKPLDEKMLRSILESHRVVITLEENVLSGGFGSQVSMFSALNSVKMAGKLHHLGVPDEFLKHAKRSLILERLGLNAAGIHSYAKNCLDGQVK